MPNLAMAEETIFSTFHTAWAARTPVDYPNMVREGEHLRTGNVPWVNFDLKHDRSDQATLGAEGGRYFTRSGHITMQVFVPAGKRGLEEATTLAMVAGNAFEGRTVGGVRFYRVGTRTIGPDGAWFQVNVEADFEFDELK